MPVAIRSFAKINIGLTIGPPGVREDGFHELRTVYQTIALHDTIRINVTSGSTGIEIKCKDPRVPQDESNTCYRIADRVMKAIKSRGKLTITIEKQLPVQGGMGAASSNAIATMLGIEQLLKKPLTIDDRLRIAEEVGSDLPLFLVGGTVLGIGRGEQVFPLPELPTMYVVVATPDIGVSTPKAFAAWDAMFHVEHGGKPAGAASPALTISQQTSKLNMFSREVYAFMCSGLNASFSPVASGVSTRGGNRAEAPLLDLVRTGIENDFERVVFTQFPELRDIKRALERAGSKYSSLSGSGSTVYGLFAAKADAEKAAAALNKQRIPAQATETLSREKYWKMLAAK
jgi:4-diphosphocytidyl-2-C-methyl-D-erythritol kinase